MKLWDLIIIKKINKNLKASDSPADANTVFAVLFFISIAACVMLAIHFA